jgi:hypothetical protein
MHDIEEYQDKYAEGYQAGKRTGFGIAALALGLVSYLSLLGLEKAVLTIVLGVLAMKGEIPTPIAKRLGIASIALGVIFILSAAVLLYLFQDKFAELIGNLKKLS